MNELSVVDGLCDWVQRSIAELRHLLLTEGLALLSEQLRDDVPGDVAGVLCVQSPERRQQVLVGCREELLLQNDPDGERREVRAWQTGGSDWTWT